MNGDARELYGFIKHKIETLSHSENESMTRAALARLRHGAGKAPGSLPQLWPMTLDGMPRALLGHGVAPSKAEWAAYTALTLFALHQQGKDPSRECMSRDGFGLGTAVRMMVTEPEDEERIKRRFDATVTAENPEEFSHHLRGLIQLMKQKDIPLDYPALGQQLYRFQFPSLRDGVRLRWGREYYSVKNNQPETDPNPTTRKEANHDENS